MELSYSVKAVIRLDKKRANGLCPINLSLRVGPKVTKISSKKSINPKDWDFDENKPKMSSKDGRLLAKFLNDKINGFETFMLEQQALGKPITLLIAQSYFGNNKSKIDLFDFWEQQVSVWKHKCSPNTIKSYDSVLKILKQFNKKLSFGDLSPMLIEQFDEYLSVMRGNSVNGRFVKHKCFRSILYRAIKNGHIKQNPYKGFTVSQTDSHREFLTIDEVKQVINLEIPEQHSNLHRVKDLFLFSCFTGLRYSDVMSLQIGNIKLGDDEARLVFDVVKTKRKLDIPLSNNALGLIQIYTPIIAKNESKLVFPTIANPTINLALKELMKLAGIEKSISFHCGRHTFASNHIESGTSIVHLKTLLGHKNIKQTQIYAKSTGKDLKACVSNLSNMYKTQKAA